MPQPIVGSRGGRFAARKPGLITPADPLIPTGWVRTMHDPMTRVASGDRWGDPANYDPGINTDVWKHTNYGGAGAHNGGGYWDYRRGWVGTPDGLECHVYLRDADRQQHEPSAGEPTPSGERLRRGPEPPDDFRTGLQFGYERTRTATIHAAGKGRDALRFEYETGPKFRVDDAGTISGRALFGWLHRADGRIGAMRFDEWHPWPGLACQPTTSSRGWTRTPWLPSTSHWCWRTSGRWRS